MLSLGRFLGIFGPVQQVECHTIHCWEMINQVKNLAVHLPVTLTRSSTPELEERTGNCTCRGWHRFLFFKSVLFMFSSFPQLIVSEVDTRLKPSAINCPVIAEWRTQGYNWTFTFKGQTYCQHRVELENHNVM